MFLTAGWRHLLMLNWEVERRLLEPFVPPGTTLDTWQGRFYVSLVGFLFLDTRVLGIPIPFHRNFEEVNLRFYVRREVSGDVRRGVVFVRELVPRRAIAAVARLVYGEPYLALPMRHSIDLTDGTLAAGANVEYGWRGPDRWISLRGCIRGEARLPAAASEEEFVTEHYWGYTGRPQRRTLEYRVEHPSWRVWPVAEATLDGEVAWLYGNAFARALRRDPCSAFVAEGSRVLVRRPTPV